MTRKKHNIPIFILMILFLLLASASAVFADDKDTGNGDADETQVEVMIEDEVVEEPLPDTSYLDDARASTGNLTFAFILDESDAESPFVGRYHDPFDGGWGYVDEFNYRGWEEGRYLRFAIADSWEPSYFIRAEFIDPGNIRAWGALSDYDFFQIPSELPASRTDFNLGLDGYSCPLGTWSFDYHYIESSIGTAAAGSLVSDWESNEANIGYDFMYAGWNGSIQFDHRTYNDKGTELNDVDHTSTTFTFGRDFGEDNYVEGVFNYGVTEILTYEDFKSWLMGINGRFENALGVDRLNITSGINWINRDEGPSVLHPDGDEFNFDIDGRWRVSPELSLHGNWAYSETDVMHADMATNWYFIDKPNSRFFDEGRWYEDTVTTNATGFGGRWIISDGFDFTIDMDWIDRDDLPMTDWIFSGSAPLQWENESRYEYTLRYRGDEDYGIEGGDWLLKYVIRNRENGYRQSDSGIEHLSINWTGMLSSDFWCYVGGGFLTTDASLEGIELIEQEGAEYGGGLSWAPDGDWSFFGDYWHYDVGGAWGYEESAFSAGLNYRLDQNWDWELYYEAVDGDFDDLDMLDYDYEELQLKLSYRW